MAGDAFTQIRNAVFRDSRLTGKAMGIFGNISTHRDGWGITPESISTQMRDGVGAIKAGLRELEEYGYLQRTRTRNANGTLGSSVYFITDQPELFDGDGEPAGLESGTSEPKVGIPPVVRPPMVEPPMDHPPVDEPTVADRLHKKTIPLQEDQLLEHQLSLPAQRPEPHPVSDEREIPVSTDQPSTAQRVVRAAGIVTADEEEAFIAWTTAKHQPRSSAWWRTVSGNGDLPDLAADWRAQGGLDATQPLTGTDATVAGWLNLADQLGGRQPHQPYRDDPWHHIKQQAAAGDRPDG